MGSTAESMNIRHLVDAGGLAVTDPDLPFVCYLKTKVQGILFKFLCITVGKFYCFLLIYTRADHPPTGVLLTLNLLTSTIVASLSNARNGNVYFR